MRSIGVYLRRYLCGLWGSRLSPVGPAAREKLSAPETASVLTVRETTAERNSQDQQEARRCHVAPGSNRGTQPPCRGDTPRPDRVPTQSEI